MKNLKTIFACLLMAVLSIGQVWADTATETIPMIGFGGLSSSGYQNVTVSGASTESSIAMVAYAFNPSNGQVRGGKTVVAGASVTSSDANKNWSLYNSAAMPGAITAIKVTQTATGSNKFQNNLYVSLGTSSQGDVTTITSAQKQDDGGSATEINFTIDGSQNYTFFKLLSTEKFTSGSVTGVTVEVTYTTGGSTPTEYSIEAAVNNESYGSVSLTNNVITASPEEGYTYASTAYTVSGGTATVTQGTGDNINKFTVTDLSADVTVTINFVAIPTHNISFNTGGLVTIEDAPGIYEGAEYTVTQTPAGSLTENCEYNTFVGWTTESSIADASVKPTLIANSKVTMSTSDITLYAVYSKTSGGGGGESGSVTLTTSTENFPTAYGTANTFTEYTLEGYKFKIQQGYINGTKLQWRASGNSNGTGIIYNIDKFPGKITSIVLTYDASDSNNNFTLNVGDSENPTSGTSITPSSEEAVYTFDCSGANADYFVLTNGTGAGYLTSIQINYGSSGATTYSLAAGCCEPLGAVGGTISWAADGNNLVASGWTVTDGGNETGYLVKLYNSDKSVVVTSANTGSKNTKTHTFTNPGAGTYWVSVTPTGSGDYCAEGEETFSAASVELSGNVVVTFMLNGGTVAGDVAKTQEVAPSTNTALTDIVTLGYVAPVCKEFGGWALSEENANAETPVVAYADAAEINVAGATSLWAIWNTKTFAVTDDVIAESVGSHNYSANPIACGETLTITCAAADAYKGNPTVTATGTHGDITVVSATEVTIANVQSAIAVSISYPTAKASYAITWNVNGTDLSGAALDGVTTSVLEGGAIEALPAAPTGLTCKNTFKGWSTKNSNTVAQTTAYYDDLFTDAEHAPVIEDATTFYAVFGSASVPSTNLFSWEGGTAADLATAAGAAQNVGSDYASTNAPYRVKLDGTGKYILIAVASQPSKVAVDVKMLGGANTSKITVQEAASTDANTFTDVEELTISGSQNDVLNLETTNSFASTTRAIKLYFTKGSNVGVGPISITGVATPDLVTQCAAVDAPTFSPAGGTFSENQSVTIATTTDGAKVYYTKTIDGSEPATPTASSTEVTGSITVDQNTKFKAIAIKDEDASDVVSATYTFQVPTPTISGATAFLENTTVTITCEGADAIYYTINGDDPTNESTLYTAPFTVDATKTIKAIAAKANWENSEIASKAFAKVTPISVADAIALIPNKNDVVDNQYVEGYVCTAGTAVENGQMTYYISDDGTETSRLQIYKGKNLNNTNFSAISDLSINDKVVIFGQLKNFNNTPEMNSGNYIFWRQGAAVASPVFSPNGGGFLTTQSVSLSCETEGAAIHYTTDGTEPTEESALYTEPFELSATTTITAAAFKGGISSASVARTFTKGTKITVAAALDALDSEDPIANQFVYGIVSTAPTADPSSGKLTYYISDDGSTTDELEIYNGYGLNGASFASKTELQAGDEVTVYGTLKTHYSTKEFDGGNYLLEFNRPTYDLVSITLPATANVRKDKTITLTPTFDPTNATNKNVTWTVESGNAYASVDAGVVTGLAEGTAVIRATSQENSAIYAECTVTVAGALPTFTEDDHEWIKITNASKLVAGRFYVIAESSKGKTATTSISSSVMGVIASTFSTDKSTIAAGALGTNTAIFELGGSADEWTLYELTDSENTGYLSGLASATFGWSADVATNTISFDESGNAILGSSAANSYRLLYNQNNNNPRFKTYTSATSTSMLLPQLYMWAELSHSVTFDANGGVAESVPGVERTDNGKIIIPATVPTHNDASQAFGGWYETSAPGVLYTVGQEFSTDVDVTLYAKWNSVPTYTVTYDANGGTGTAPAEPATVIEGATITVLENTGFTNPGFAFEGWMVTYNDGEEKVIEPDENSQFPMPAYNVVIKAVWGTPSNQKWVLVTDVAELEAGKKYVIAAAGDKEYAMSTTQNSNNRGQTAIVKSGNQMSGTNSMQIITLEGATGAWEFNVGGSYLYAAGSDKNYLRTQTTNDANGQWTISISTDGEGVTSASIVASGSSNRNVLRYNSGNKLFSCYASSSNESPVALYREKELTQITENGKDEDDVQDGNDVEIGENVTWTVSTEKTVGDVYLKEGAVVNNSATLHAQNLYFKTKAGKSNQIMDISSIALVEDLYYDIQLCNGTLDADYWYCIAVPFDVNIQNGVFLADGTPLTAGTDYEVWIFDPQKRAQSQANGWKRANGKMEAGRAYLIGFNPGMPNTVRLKAAAGWKDHLFSGASIPVESTTTGEAGRYDNWNGIANPTMKYIGINTDVQVFNNDTHQFDPQPYDKDDYNYVVGTPFFVQATSTSVAIEAADNAQFRAPKRDALEVEKYSNCVRIARAEAETYDNQIIVRASEEATSDYQAGHDMLTLNNTTSKTSALLWTENYGGQRLAIEEAPLVNNSAVYTLGIYAPADGDYTISADQGDANIYLTYEGRVIWDLTAVPYTLNLTKGSTAGYGLRIIAAPRATTDIENIYNSTSGVQKVMLNGTIFILRGEQMYDATGRMIK